MSEDWHSFQTLIESKSESIFVSNLMRNNLDQDEHVDTEADQFSDRDKVYLAVSLFALRYGRAQSVGDYQAKLEKNFKTLLAIFASKAPIPNLDRMHHSAQEICGVMPHTALVGSWTFHFSVHLLDIHYCC